MIDPASLTPEQRAYKQKIESLEAARLLPNGFERDSPDLDNLSTTDIIFFATGCTGVGMLAMASFYVLYLFVRWLF